MKANWKRLLPYFSSHKSDFSVAACAMAFDAAFSSISIWMLKVVIDQIFIDKDIEMLKDLVWIIPILFLFKGFFSFNLNYRMTKIGHAIARKIRDDLMSKILFLDHRYHSQHKSSDLLARVTNDVATVANMTSNAPLYVIRDGLTVLFLSATILWLNIKFAALILVTIPVFAGVFLIFITKLRKITQKTQELIAILYGTIGEAMHGLTTIKVFLYEERWLKKFQDQNEAHCKAMLKFQRVTALSPALMECLSVLVVTAILFWGGLEVIRGSWSAGDFMTFLGASFAVYMPIKHLSQVNPIIQMGLSSWKRICELQDAPLPLDTVSDPFSSNETSILLNQQALPMNGILGGAPLFKEEIRFENIGLTYPDGRPGVRDVTLTIKKGSRLGIAGQSGSGKTSLVMMLARFYEPTQGNIYIDNIEVRAWPIAHLRKLLAFVTQEAFLFDDTIESNIRVGNPQASRRELEEAAYLAHASEFIEQLPLKFETPVGERGVRLSGGQKQRIAIARAILKKPQILILDEATSNLDPESEELVLDAIKALLKDKTAIIISHRMQTLESAERIVVMEGGSIVEEVAKKELLGHRESRLERLMGL